ncbi:hypothetical protein FQR65_LT10236 [Abscondita terminalis]|nr:hypothetical protein FQR65_LT10236 [Abscondita terminalis]
MQQILAYGVNPGKIIFAHTCKYVGHIKFAAENKIDLMTFDCKEELHKIKDNFQSVRTVLRIKCDDPLAQIRLGTKFGCDAYTESEELLMIAFKHKINVVGVSFHIGWASKNPEVFNEAIKAARYVFDVSEKLGHRLYLLDIGGGIPGKNHKLISTYAKHINQALNAYFPDNSVRIISEPGTYFVQSAFTLTCYIHSLKEKYNQSNTSYQYDYHINDGVYGNLATVIIDKTKIVPRPLQVDERKLYVSTVWGPTCDSLDRICDNVLLPKMNVGDWMIIDDIGSYSNVIGTLFNGFGVTNTYAVINLENM